MEAVRTSPTTLHGVTTQKTEDGGSMDTEMMVFYHKDTWLHNPEE